MPTDNKFSTLEAVASVLEPLSHFTDALSGEKCITVSAVRPLLSHIMDNCLRASPDDCAIVKEMKEINCRLAIFTWKFHTCLTNAAI